MILYHGSHIKFAEFKSPQETGKVRCGEEGRRVNLDVVFFTADVRIAIQYAGAEGYLYETHVPEEKATTLMESRHSFGGRKTAKCNEAILVAKPEDCHIIDVWRLAKQKRGNGHAIYQEAEGN